MALIRIIAALAILSCCAGAQSGEMLSVPATSGWEFSQTGSFDGWTDRRELLVLYHPWEESAGHAYGSVSTSVTIPAEWQGRFVLHFYMTDDYDASQEPLTEGWLGQINLRGHRFKQVLVNDSVIWEQDVADAEGVDQPARHSVALPDSVKGGNTITIAARLMDKVGSATRLAGDSRYIGTTDGIQESDPWRFMTHLYAGDFVLTPSGATEVERRELPSARAVRRRHEEYWPLEPPGGEVEFPVTLQVQGGGAGIARPLHCGVPFPAARVSDVNLIQLTLPDGSRLLTQCAPTNYWPDGSIRWVDISAILPAHVDRVLLEVRNEAGEFQRVVEPPRVELRLGMNASSETIVNQVSFEGVQLNTLEAAVVVGNQMFRPALEHMGANVEGRVYAQIEVRGKLRADDIELGRFVARIDTYVGVPVVRMTWRTFCDRAATPDISSLRLTAMVPMDDGASVSWSQDKESDKTSVTLVQDAADHFQVKDRDGAEMDSGEHAPGWLAIRGENQTFAVFVRDFAEQFPKGLSFDGEQLDIALFHPTEAEPLYQPHEGEAKRHEIWFGLWPRSVSDDEMVETIRAFDEPARLFNADYFCASGGFGDAYPHDETRFQRLTAFMGNTYGDITPRQFFTPGIRHWGDSPYNPEENTWRNGYYDSQQGFAVEYLMTGDPRWFRVLEANVRHIMDVDVCHASQEHPDWVGSIRGYFNADHSTGGPWNPTQRTKGMLAYARLAADPDARAAALSVADSAMAANRGIGARSVRDHAGILYCLTAAYDETLNPKYLECARRVAQDAMSRIDPRRGCYAEVHGNLGYRGNVPWMVAQLAEPLYDYYRQSGDVEAAVAVVGLAESIITENCARGVLGDVYGYSHNPHFTKNSGYHILIAPAIMYAYELTGDPEFLAHARAMYDQTIREGTVNSIMNCYWNTQTLLYYLDKFDDSREDRP